jgi:hypothetical protein
VTVVMTTIDVMIMAAIKTPMEIWRFFLEIIILIVWKQGSGMRMQCTQLTRTVGVGQRLETRQLQNSWSSVVVWGTRYKRLYRR